MAFTFDLSPKLKFKIKKLLKKDRKKVEIITSKIRQVINTDQGGIDKRYKNLRYDSSNSKRVHIEGPFVMTFRVDKANNFIYFKDYDHHDRIYER